MRPLVWFIVLLLLAATATSLVWQNLPLARAGDLPAQVVVLSSTAVALPSVVLSGRIVAKVSAARRAKEGA